MRLISEHDEFEAQVEGPDRFLIRGRFGGRAPAFVSPERLLELGRWAPERRTPDPWGESGTRRLGAGDRRRLRRGDRRVGLWVASGGRRRADVFSWADDRDVARASERLAVYRRRASWPPLLPPGGTAA